jgi:precorrin-2 dehydrogenase/sirohydrochlorin ferrochelatase
MGLDVTTMDQTSLLPMMVRMKGRSCLVVGGGRVAERKAAALLEAGAAVTVVSPSFTEQLKLWAEEGLLFLEEREYAPGEGEAAFLIVAATDRQDVNEHISSVAAMRGQLVNSASEPLLGSVILPAVLRRGPLTVTVSTAGASPAAAIAIRDRIDALLGEDVERLLNYLECFRRMAKARVPDATLRRQLLKRLVSGDVFSRLSNDGWKDYEAEMQRLLEEAELACKDAVSAQEAED